MICCEENSPLMTVERIMPKCFDNEGDTTVKSVTADAMRNNATFRDSSHRVNVRDNEIRSPVSDSQSERTESFQIHCDSLRKAAGKGISCVPYCM